MPRRAVLLQFVRLGREVSLHLAQPGPVRVKEHSVFGGIQSKLDGGRRVILETVALLLRRLLKSGDLRVNRGEPATAACTDVLLDDRELVPEPGHVRGQLGAVFAKLLTSPLQLLLMFEA